MLKQTISALVLAAMLLTWPAAADDTPKMEVAGQKQFLFSGHSLAVARFHIGMNKEKQDAGAGASWFRLAADQGFALAQHNLGALYSHGRGVPQDAAAAAHWFRLAAEQGLAKSQAALGYLYLKGQGVGQDDTEALRLSRLAAEQGNVTGQHNLGTMYAIGRAVKKDVVQAYVWVSLAAEQGLESAEIMMRGLTGEMTADQIAVAKALAQEFKRQRQTKTAA